MDPNIKRPEVEKLAEAAAAMTGKSKTEALRHALAKDFMRYLEEEVWPKAPPGQLGRRLTREEEDEILDYGPEGV